MSNSITPEEGKPDSVAKVPPEVVITFTNGQQRRLQVNFCKNPKCPNYGVPAQLAKYARRGKSAQRQGTEYTMGSGAANFPLLKCLLCGEHLPIKSNQGVAEHREVVDDIPGLLQLLHRR